MSWIKLFFINVLVTLSLVGMLIISPPIIYNGYQMLSFGKNSTAIRDPRSDLDIYADFAWSQQHFKEFKELSTSYHDYVTWRRDDYSGETINIVDGVRTTYSDVITASSSKEFWFFGGSTTWGTGVTDSLTYPSMFARNNEVKVINFGESGYIARQSLSYLQNIIIQSESDSSSERVIVFYDGVNDVANRCRTENEGISTSREAQIRETIKLHSVKKYAFSRPFAQLSDVLNAIATKLGKKEYAQTFYDCANDPSRAYEVAQTLVRTWESAAKISEANGERFVAILQPVAFLSNRSLPYLSLNSQNDLALSKQYEAVYPIVKRLANKSDITFFDLTMVYDSCNDCYIDFAHVGPQAHTLLSNALSASILGSLQ